MILMSNLVGSLLLGPVLKCSVVANKPAELWLHLVTRWVFDGATGNGILTFPGYAELVKSKLPVALCPSMCDVSLSISYWSVGKFLFNDTHNRAD